MAEGDGEVQSFTHEEKADSSNNLYRLAKKKNVRVVIWVVVAIIAIIAVIVALLNIPVEESEPTVLTEMDRLKLAIESGDISQCDQFNPVKRSVCEKTIGGELGPDYIPPVTEEQTIIELAASQNDSSLCENIISPVAKNICLIEVGLVEPNNMGEPTYNPETNTDEPSQYEIDNQLFQQAVNEGNPELCNQIMSPILKDLCISQS